jgi:EAL domain-containing protein (putative c-di-GMP-specific phosphodiesterase class I)
MGVQVSIDDFGTGYSSLGYLQRLPIDRLKIDRTFVLELPVSDDAKALSAAVVGLAASLHLDVVAEGVETIEQLEILESLNCFKVQGFLIARPLRAEQARQFLEDGPPVLLGRDNATRTEATQSAV